MPLEEYSFNKTEAFLVAFESFAKKRPIRAEQLLLALKQFVMRSMDQSHRLSQSPCATVGVFLEPPGHVLRTSASAAALVLVDHKRKSFECCHIYELFGNPDVERELSEAAAKAAAIVANYQRSS